MPDFRVHAFNEPHGVRVIEVTGEARVEISQRLQDAVLASLTGAAAPPVVLDLAGLEHLDSASTSALIRLREAVVEQRGGTLVLCGLRPVVYRVLDVTGLAPRFTILDDREKALAHLTER